MSFFHLVIFSFKDLSLDTASGQGCTRAVPGRGHALPYALPCACVRMCVLVRTWADLECVPTVWWTISSQGEEPGPTERRALEDEPLLAARMVVEDCMCLLLDVDDIDRLWAVSMFPLDACSPASRAQPAAQTQHTAGNATSLCIVFHCSQSPMPAMARVGMKAIMPWHLCPSTLRRPGQPPINCAWKSVMCPMLAFQIAYPRHRH